MKGCKNCQSISTISIFISVAAVILALMAYFHKIKQTEGLEDNTKWETQRTASELIYTFDGNEAMKLGKNGDLTIRGQLLADGDITVGTDIIKKEKPYYLKVEDGDKFVKYDEKFRLGNFVGKARRS